MATKKPSKKTVILRVILAIGTPISLFFVPWVLVRVLITPLPDTIQEQMNQGIELGFDGMIVYVDQAGKEPSFYGAGYKNRDHELPADPHAFFKIASISKLYVAASITKLEYEGKLSLDGTLAEYFPEYSERLEYTDRITVRMMVQNRSGLPNFTDTPDFWSHPKVSAEQAMELILEMPAEFEPDADWMYSNTNYLLLTMLIEKVTEGASFDYIKKVLLDPLDLQNTYGSIHDISIDDLMSGYYVGVEEDIKSTDYGAMIATAEDVGKFVRAMNDGSLFTNEEQVTYESIYELGHGGLIPGYQSYAYYHADIDAVVVQMVNTTDFNGYEWNMHQIIYRRIVRILRRQSD